MSRFITADGVELWAEDFGDPARPTLLLVMGANAGGLTWPDEFLALLAETHHVIRYDHRDTGRSTHAYAEKPYAITKLATDAVAVLDGFGVDRAHVVGMSLGGILGQLLLLDHPDRLHTMTLLCTVGLFTADAPEWVGPPPELAALWQEMGAPRDRDAEVDWRVRHWKVLNGGVLPFDETEFRRMEERVIEHAGTHTEFPAHAHADTSGLARGDELANVRTPTLVVQGPLDPVNPPPHGEHLAKLIPGAELVEIPGMGHALPSAVHKPLAEAILRHARP
ncbi:alpha/beta fold hydrolase [Actinokineospora sp. HUAS TT18]|uniref:alpha/beta fold hydrolase n=1 Tax=Actinokineospora sp. HUAS TT18 TaxID=3447451 RepID=UPI003F5229D2